MLIPAPSGQFVPSNITGSYSSGFNVEYTPVEAGTLMKKRFYLLMLCFFICLSQNFPTLPKFCHDIFQKYALICFKFDYRTFIFCTRPCVFVII